jgi:hypothetical protein
LTDWRHFSIKEQKATETEMTETDSYRGGGGIKRQAQTETGTDIKRSSEVRRRHSEKYIQRQRIRLIG